MWLFVIIWKAKLCWWCRKFFSVAFVHSKCFFFLSCCFLFVSFIYMLVLCILMQFGWQQRNLITLIILRNKQVQWTSIWKIPISDRNSFGLWQTHVPRIREANFIHISKKKLLIISKHSHILAAELKRSACSLL